MARKKKTYRIVRPLPDGLGAVLIGGAPLGPGTDLPPDTAKKVILDCLARELIEVVGNPKAAVVSQTPAQKAEWRKRLRPISKWKINPVDLIGKTLVELNIMILEKDPDAEPFAEFNHALEYLSKDYED